MISTDIRRFLGYAALEEPAPADLRDRIAVYMWKHYASLPSPSSELNQRKWVKLSELSAHGNVDKDV
jgi:hypothetical protein